MKYSFNTFAYSSFPTLLPTFSLEATIRSLAGIGYDAVEIGCCAPHAWPDFLDRSRRSDIRRLCDGEGIAVSALLPAIGGGFGCNPCSIIEAERAATVEHYKRIVDLAADLDSGLVLFIAGWCADGVSRELGFERSVACLRTVAEHGARNGVAIAIEPTPADTNLINTAADARQLMSAAGMKNVGLMFDTIHVAYNGETLPSYVHAMGDRLLHLHAADTGRKSLGAGAMDWHSLVSALVHADYRGYFGVETGFGSREIDPREVAERSLAYIRGVEAAVRQIPAPPEVMQFPGERFMR